MASCATAVGAMYSASREERGIVGCFRFFHETDPRHSLVHSAAHFNQKSSHPMISGDFSAYIHVTNSAQTLHFSAKLNIYALFSRLNSAFHFRKSKHRLTFSTKSSDSDVPGRFFIFDEFVAFDRVPCPIYRSCRYSQC